ncbi:hypothetical protein BGZ94_009048 [Podila epigama]|nr:hypothetical protein BGZ94_009048 [Podila epigama]
MASQVQPHSPANAFVQEGSLEQPPHLEVPPAVSSSTELPTANKATTELPIAVVHDTAKGITGDVPVVSSSTAEDRVSQNLVAIETPTTGSLVALPSAENVTRDSSSTTPSKQAQKVKSLYGTVKKTLNRLTNQVEELEAALHLLEPEASTRQESTSQPSVKEKDQEPVAASHERAPLTLNRAESAPGPRMPKDISHGRGHGRRPFRFFGVRKPSWTLRVLAHRNVERIMSLDTVDLREPTIRCLHTEKVYDAPLTKCIINPLITGDDILLQLRGPKLLNYITYTLIDVVSDATPELQAVVVVNRLDAQSSKLLSSHLQRQFKQSETPAGIHVIPNDPYFDFGPLASAVPDKPRVFVSTPHMLPRLKEAKLLHDDYTHIMVVYEAEYVARTKDHIQTIKKFLETMKVCQAVLACQVMTEDVVKAGDELDFTSEAVVYSIDYENMTQASHYTFTEKATELAVLNYAIERSKECPVVILCFDSEYQNLKGYLSSKTRMITAVASNAEQGILPNGVLLTTQVHNQLLQTKVRTGVRFILNMAKDPPLLERYLEMLSSYMDMYEPCQVVTRVSSPSSFDAFKPFGVTVEHIQDATLPF